MTRKANFGQKTESFYKLRLQASRPLVTGQRIRDRIYDGRMTRFRLFLLFALCLPSWADSGLDALHATLTEMRGKSPDSGGPRGATPALTVVKHQWRDWVESRLKSLALRGDEEELGSRLNAELREAKLVCDDTAADQPRCPDQDRVGFSTALSFADPKAF